MNPTYCRRVSVSVLNDGLHGFQPLDLILSLEDYLPALVSLVCLP